MKLTKFQKAIGLSIGLILVVAVFDFFHYPDSFWMYSIMLAVVASGIYYIFKKDKSEALAVFSSFLIMLYSGLEDLFFYVIRPIFQAEPAGIPASMPHLYNHPIIGNIAKLLGYETVTPGTLIISIALGGLVTYYVVQYLKQKW